MASAFCPFLFLLLLILLSFGKASGSSYKIFEDQFQRELLFYDLQSRVNDLFLSQQGIIHTTLRDIQVDIQRHVHMIEELETVIDSERYIKYVVTHKTLADLNNVSINLWGHQGSSGNFDIRGASEFMLNEITTFSMNDEADISYNDPNYEVWSVNLQDQYHSALTNWTQATLDEYKTDSSIPPFNTITGLVFFFCTFLIVSINYFNIYLVFTLRDDTMGIFLRISQPDLDALKNNCKNFTKYIEIKAFERATNPPSTMITNQLPTTLQNIPEVSRVKTAGLKSYRKFRTTLETRMFNLLVLIIITTLFIFIFPSVLQRKDQKLLKDSFEDLTTLLEIESRFNFGFNTMKQELIHPVPLLSGISVPQYLLNNSQIIKELSEDLRAKWKKEGEDDTSDLWVLRNAFVNGDFCAYVEEENLRYQCNRFDDGLLKKGLIPALLKNNEALRKIAEDLQTKERQAQLHDLVDLKFNTFREAYLGEGFRLLRERYAAKFSSAYQETTKKIFTFELCLAPVWIVLICVMYFGVIRPLYMMMGQRKKLVCVIPFPLLIRMKDNLMDFIEVYCNLPPAY